MWDIISGLIFFTKKYFSLWFFHFYHDPKVDDESVPLILKVNRRLKVTYILE